MKNQISPISFPTDDFQHRRWGFDVVEPNGSPMAWVHDWTTVSPGFDVSEEQVGATLAYETLDPADIPVGDILGTHSMFMKLYWHTTIGMVEAVSGKDKAREVAETVGRRVGIVTWSRDEDLNTNGKMPLSGIAWRLDAAALFSGSWNKSYTWCDDLKVVTSSTSDFLKPVAGLEDTYEYYDATIAASVEASLASSPGLLSAVCTRSSEEGYPARSLRVWSYDRATLEQLPADWDRSR